MSSGKDHIHHRRSWTFCDQWHQINPSNVLMATQFRWMAILSAGLISGFQRECSTASMLMAHAPVLQTTWMWTWSLVAPKQLSLDHVRRTVNRNAWRTKVIRKWGIRVQTMNWTRIKCDASCNPQPQQLSLQPQYPPVNSSAMFAAESVVQRSCWSLTGGLDGCDEL